MPQPKNVQIITQNPYSPRNNIYYVSQIMKAYKHQRSLAREHIVQSLHIMRILQSVRMPSNQEIQKRKLNLPIKKHHLNKRVIIFDLDQTLIHCNDSLKKNYDFKVQIKFSANNILQAGVNIRPYAKQILKNLSEHFQIIIFTASQSCYADQVINIIDPNKQYVSHRLYRQHCYLSSQGMYIKDLRIINRPLSNILLIDNAAYSYYFQLQNGVPIIPYYHGQIDYQLKALQKYLLQFVFEKDVRRINRKTFQFHRYCQYYNTPNKLVEELYIENK